MGLSKKQEYLIIAGLLILIFPFFALLFYVHPQNDDFGFALNVQNQGVIDFLKNSYLNWTGRYFSMFLGAFDPLRYHSLSFYRFILFIIHALNIFFLYKLLRVLIDKSISKLKIFVITILIHLVYINGVVDLYELLYWYPSVTAYTLGQTLFLILLTISILKNRNEISKIPYLLLASLISFLIIGLHELFVIPMIFFIIIDIYFRYKKNREISIELIVLLVIIVSSGIVIFAPGNYTRVDNVTNLTSGYQIIFLTIESTILVVGYFLQNAVFILGSILFASYVFYLISHKKIRLEVPLISPYKIISVSVLVIFSLFLPFTISLDVLPSGRVFNLISFFFFIIWIINIVLIIKYYEHKYNLYLSNLYLVGVSVLMFLFTFNGVYITDKVGFAENKKESIFLNGNILKSYYVLIFEAKDFNKEMNARQNSFKQAKENGDNILLVKPLKTHPEILLFVDLNKINKPKPHLFYWESKYYGMDSIKYLKSKAQ